MLFDTEWFLKDNFFIHESKCKKKIKFTNFKSKSVVKNLYLKIKTDSVRA